MTKDEVRINQLLDDPNDDKITDDDLTYIRAGVLLLNWTETPHGKAHPCVTPSSVAVTYMTKHGRLTPQHRRTLKGLVTRKVKADVQWAKKHIQEIYK